MFVTSILSASTSGSNIAARFCLIDDAKVGRFSMQNMDFFELSRPTIRHYTYSPFSLYALYAQPTLGHKKSEQKSICSLKNLFSSDC